LKEKISKRRNPRIRGGEVSTTELWKKGLLPGCRGAKRKKLLEPGLKKISK